MTIQSIIPQYLYQQYSDDDNLQAFVAAFNATAQSYLTWFNQTPLAIYTNPSVYGPLLDYLATAIYGYGRPSLVTPAAYGPWYGGYGYSVMGEQPTAMIERTKSAGAAALVNDDYYKRALTWHLYKGDGMQMSVSWMKKRIARFLYGADGVDISMSLLQNIGITFPSTGTLMATIPAGASSNIFQTLISGGYLAVPFQIKFEVTVL
jgi:hypothetical protein